MTWLVYTKQHTRISSGHSWFNTASAKYSSGGKKIDFL